MKIAHSLILLALLSALGLGCGKKALPQPQDEREMFRWTGAKATAKSDCLSIDAQLVGNLRNVAGVVLELEAADTGEQCANCPFLPVERKEFAIDNLSAQGKSGRITLDYCPTVEAPAYRWRLVGRNVYRTFPYQLTQVQTVVMPRK